MRRKTNDLREDQDRASAKGRGNRDPVRSFISKYQPKMPALSRYVHLPEEVAKAKYQDGHTSKLNDVGQGSIVVFHQIAKHGPESQRREALCEAHGRHGNKSRDLPTRAPVEGVVRRARGLGDEHTVGFVLALDEVMASDVCHDLGAGEDLDVELILDLLQLLKRVNGSLLRVFWSWFNIPPGGSPSPW